MIEEILTGALWGFIVVFMVSAGLWLHIRFVQEGPR